MNSCHEKQHGFARGRRQLVAKVRMPTYICGDCGHDIEMTMKTVVRCRKCGGRILFKKRTPKLVQYQAR